MQLVVKRGREYVLGGRVYRSGETVDGVPDKNVRILTAPRGPLEHPTQRRQVTTDLPPEVMNRAMVAEATRETPPQLEPQRAATEPEEAPPYPEPEEEARPTKRGRRYGRRDLSAEE